ncbi:MAG TPA: UDP-glucose/GDP-mannose dehydrogenase family protein [Candidatus Baltobacteraceae bacterium]|nr:UDP-glucose/GDP-mannose dehydrogenase family protein [Candidatus Baltobacteraceae bacterium]
MYNVAVFGCGYVGLVTAACLAHMRNTVCCYDTDVTKIRSLQNGEVHFYEPGLQQLVCAQQTEGRLTFTGSAEHALANTDVAFIAVGTPIGPTGEADLTYVRQAAREIASCACGPLIVVNKSTVPVETADMVERIVNANAASGNRFSVASNPEFLREGSAIGDFLHPDRVVIGAEDEHAVTVLRRLYEPLGAAIIVVDVHTAEMIKYAANAFLAMKISFINEIANLCGAVNADIDGVVAGIGADARIGRTYLEPGLGFGGSCLPKDVSALAHVARRHAIEPTMLEATLGVNRRQIGAAMRLIETALGDLCERRIVVAGVAFKGGTDDLRESPALVLVEALLTAGCSVAVHDAHALARARSVLRERVAYYASVYEACAGSAALVIANDNRAYARLDWTRISRALAAPNVIDLRNRLDPAVLARAGLQYAGVGRRRTRRVSQKEKTR